MRRERGGGRLVPSAAHRLTRTDAKRKGRGACGFTGVLGEALSAFMAVLDRYTLADLITSKADIAGLFMQDEPVRDARPAENFK